MVKVSPEERDELDKAARWRRTTSGWVICDPSLDADIDAIPLELIAAIHGGRNVTRRDVDAALAREAEKSGETIPLMGREFPARS